MLQLISILHLLIYQDIHIYSFSYRIRGWTIDSYGFRRATATTSSASSSPGPCTPSPTLSWPLDFICTHSCKQRFFFHSSFLCGNIKHFCQFLLFIALTQQAINFNEMFTNSKTKEKAKKIFISLKENIMMQNIFFSANKM